MHVGESPMKTGGRSAARSSFDSVDLFTARRRNPQGQRLFGLVVRFGAEEVLEVGLEGTGSSFSR